MAKIISFFNHKGGVGKTTLVHNLAFALADLDKKVLVIDGDPQMNLTAAMFGLSTSIEYSEEENSKWKILKDKNLSIFEYLQNKLQQGSISKPFFNSKILSTSQKQTVDLLCGDINLPTIEAELFGILKSNNSFNRNIVSNFEKSIKDFKENYDFILIDTSPSASSIINSLLIFSSDYFLAPTSQSFFSIQAIDNLSNVFDNWLSLINGFYTAIGLKGLSLNVKFLGIIIQMAKRYKSSGSTAATRWIGEVNTSIKRFEKYAARKDFIITEEEFMKIFKNKGANDFKSQPFIIEKCCDFTPMLRSIAEHFGIPVIYLTQELCNKYVKEHNDKVKDYNKNLAKDEIKMKPITSSPPNISNEERKDNQYKRSFDSISKSYHKIAADLISS